jgi:pimeloyl-ACP methyl ester carboxylesterase
MRHAIALGVRRLEYLEAGDPAGRVLVLLHAFPLSARMWKPQLATVPDGWRFIAPDLAGFGGTDDRDGDSTTLDDYADDVVTMLDALEVRDAGVGGLSLGGYVTLAVARRAPDRITCLILADTKAPGDNTDQRAARDRLVTTLDAGGPEAVATEMLPRLLGQTTMRGRSELVEHVRSLITSNRAPGLRRAILRLRDRPDAGPYLADVAVRTLVLVGDEDTPTPVADARALAGAITGARLEIIDGAGHLSNLERPEAFTTALTRFLTT